MPISTEAHYIRFVTCDITASCYGHVCSFQYIIFTNSVGTFTIYLCYSTAGMFNSIKQKANYRFVMAAMLLFYIYFKKVEVKNWTPFESQLLHVKSVKSNDWH
jgi:hypothetical protein